MSNPAAGENGLVSCIKVRLVVTGRHYHMSQSLPHEMEFAAGATSEDALRRLASYMNNDQQLPASCLVVVSGQHLGTVAAHDIRTLADGDELVLIAPVAGG
jgi:molybdopterin converting factor small subunit